MRAALLLVLLGACGGDDGGATPDAAKTIDGTPSNAAQTYACDGTQVATITTVNGTLAFTPNTATISVGQNIKFSMDSTHSVVSDTTGGDPGLAVNFGDMNRCLKFVRAGTYKFHCAAHASMTGTITVNP